VFEKYQNIELYGVKLKQDKERFTPDKWFIAHRFVEEIDLFQAISEEIRDVLTVFEPRDSRCRATTRRLAVVQTPVTTTYYCAKHAGKSTDRLALLKSFRGWGKIRG